MAVSISGRHTQVSAATKEYIEKANGKLEQFFDRIISSEVIVSQEGSGTKVEFIVKVPQQTLVSSAYTAGDNLFKTIDDAQERIKIQLKKYHDKIVEHR